VPALLFFPLTLGLGLLGKPPCLLGEFTCLRPGPTGGFARVLPRFRPELRGSAENFLTFGRGEAQSFGSQPRVLAGVGLGLPPELPGLIPDFFTIGIGQPRAFRGFPRQLPRSGVELCDSTPHLLALLLGEAQPFGGESRLFAELIDQLFAFGVGHA
jgi:hypothetical protein